jgi:hypothetical protein
MVESKALLLVALLAALLENVLAVRMVEEKAEMLVGLVVKMVEQLVRWMAD